MFFTRNKKPQVFSEDILKDIIGTLVFNAVHFEQVTIVTIKFENITDLLHFLYGLITINKKINAYIIVNGSKFKLSRFKYDDLLMELSKVDLKTVILKISDSNSYYFDFLTK